MGELGALVTRDYFINGRRSAWRAEDALTHLNAHLDRIPPDESHELSIRYILLRTSEGAAAATIRYEIAILARALHLAARSGRIKTKPVLAHPAVHNARSGFVSRENIRALLRALEEPVRSIAAFAYVTGWRKSEILALTWGQVDWESGTVRLEPGSTKNREGRTYPFHAHPQLARILDTWAKRRSGSHVFHRRGVPVRDFRRAWEIACREVGLRNTLFHDLRRSAVRNLERAGVPRSVAMLLTGHRTESIYRRYAIANEDDLSRGVRLVARLEKRRGTKEAPTHRS